MQILQGTKLTRKAQVEAANFLEADWFLGLARKRNQFPHQLPKQNILLQEAVVHRFFG